MSIHFEDNASQHEIDLRYTETLDMADNIMTLRLIVRKIALDAGIHATLPKPLDKGQGSECIHMSLFEGDVNVFQIQATLWVFQIRLVNSWLGASPCSRIYGSYQSTCE